MRVLFFNYEYPPLGGGAGNATFCILQEFSKIPDLKVDLITSSVDKNFHLEKVGENISIHKIPIGDKQKDLHHQSQKDLLIYTWKAYFYAKKLIKQNSYDLSHSFFTVPCGFISWRFLKKYKIPYIISLRGADVPGYAERFSLLYKFITPLIKKIWKDAAEVIANSQGLKELALKSNPKQKIGIIYNGIDTEKFKPANVSKDNHKFVITPGASRLTSRKGLFYLIKAVDKLSKKYPQIELKIMGDGEGERVRLEEIVDKLNLRGRVVFLGRIPREKTFSYYQEADVFVLPSLNEGMSNAMLEALATGLPILATDTGGSKELITEGGNGYIIEMKNAQDIADKLEKIINNSELRKKMGEASRKKALEMSWEKVAKKYYQTYEKNIYPVK
jgi:glycosyltransferase involved in cell wall biosynthesis